MTMRALVTGGSGFIGTHLVERLLADGHAVCNVDLKRPAIAEHESHWSSGDLMDAERLRTIVTAFQPDVMFNLAAVADISLKAADMLPNTEGLRNLLAAGRALDTLPRLVHISTQLVVEAGYEPEDDRDYKPYTEYGVSKAESEKLLWEEAGDYTWTILRPTTIWGPWHASFPDSTYKYLNRRWYMIPTQTQPVRSYGYVGNVVEQMVAAATLEASRVDRRVFNVGDDPMPTSTWLDGLSREMTGKPCRRIPFAALKLLAMGGDLSKRIGGPAPLDSGRLYRMTTDYRVPMQPTYDTLGRGPVSLEEGIKRTVTWLRTARPEEFSGRE